MSADTKDWLMEECRAMLPPLLEPQRPFVSNDGDDWYYRFFDEDY